MNSRELIHPKVKHVKSESRKKVDVPPQYIGSEWDIKISSPDNPNFWKFGVPDLVFLDHEATKVKITNQAILLRI